MEKYKINLQHFAEPNTNVTTDSGLSVEMKILYDAALIDEAGPQLVHDQFGQKRNIPQGKGKKITIFTYVPNKKSTRKKQGHRQPYTKIEIKKIK